jgi:pilus assembly protein Flp/PilA
MQKLEMGRWRRVKGSAQFPGWARLSRRVRSGSLGQGMVEYSLILMLVALVVMVIFVLVGHRVSDMYSNINNGLAG